MMFQGEKSMQQISRPHIFPQTKILQPQKRNIIKSHGNNQKLADAKFMFTGADIITQNAY